MKEIVTMWRHTQLVVLVALSAAIYAAVLIPFKGFAIVPGFIELRPANAFPVVFGLLFGPAGAWGSAIGNLIGDFFGTLTLGSIGGFAGNFFLALLPYKVWGAFFRGRDLETNVDSGKRLLAYVAVTILASAACAAIISWWIAVLGLYPFPVFFALIFFNNAIIGGVIGPILLFAFYPRVKRWGLLWTEIMRPEEVSAPRLQRIGNVLVWIGTIGAVVVGLIFGLSSKNPGAPGVVIGVALFLIVVVVASFMLGGREQVEAAEEMVDTEGRETRV